jgi:hypothetical protein
MRRKRGSAKREPEDCRVECSLFERLLEETSEEGDSGTLKKTTKAAARTQMRRPNRTKAACQLTPILRKIETA